MMDVIVHQEQERNEKFLYVRGVPPPITVNPSAWFDFTDQDYDGLITQEEVIISMFAALRPNPSQRLTLRKKIQDNWGRFDKSNKMYLLRDEFFDSGIVNFLKGLEDWWKLSQLKPNLRKPKLRRAVSAPPEIQREPQRWFEHYDADQSCTLNQSEVIYGLCQALQPATVEEKTVIREVVENSWSTFDLDYEGTINKWEFLCKGGFATYLNEVIRSWKSDPQNRTTQHLMNIHVLGVRRHSYLPPPNIEQLEKWFDHFDIDYSGCLSQTELITGLFVTLNTCTSAQRNVIRQYIVSVWDTYDHNNNQVIEKDEFLGTNNFGADLIQFVSQYDARGLLEEDEEGDFIVMIKVNVPEGKKGGDMIQLASPVSHEVVMLMIPEKVKWGGGGEEPFFFNVKFSKNHS